MNKTQLNSLAAVVIIAIIAAIFTTLTRQIESGVAVYILHVLILTAALFASLWLQKRTAARLRPKEVAVSMEPVRETGTVKWFNVDKGFGFIVRENGEDLFIHFRALRDGEGSTEHLAEGLRVEYQIGQGRKGPQAEDVVIIH